MKRENHIKKEGTVFYRMANNDTYYSYSLGYIYKS